MHLRKSATHLAFNCLSSRLHPEALNTRSRTVESGLFRAEEKGNSEYDHLTCSSCSTGLHCVWDREQDSPRGKFLLCSPSNEMMLLDTALRWWYSSLFIIFLNFRNGRLFFFRAVLVAFLHAQWKVRLHARQQPSSNTAWKNCSAKFAHNSTGEMPTG